MIFYDAALVATRLHDAGAFQFLQALGKKGRRHTGHAPAQVVEPCGPA